MIGCQILHIIASTPLVLVVACIPDRPESQLSAICRSSHLHGQRILGILLQSLWQGVDSLTVPEVLSLRTLVTDEIVALLGRSNTQDFEHHIGITLTKHTIALCREMELIALQRTIL